MGVFKSFLKLKKPREENFNFSLIFAAISLYFIAQPCSIPQMKGIATLFHLTKNKLDCISSFGATVKFVNRSFLPPNPVCINRMYLYT